MTFHARVKLFFWLFCLLCIFVHQKIILICYSKYDWSVFSASFREAEIVMDDDEGVMYVNDDMSLADTDSVNELAFEVGNYAVTVVVSRQSEVLQCSLVLQLCLSVTSYLRNSDYNVLFIE